jgi:hypothetical protein
MTPPVAFDGAYYISLEFCFDVMQVFGLVLADSVLYRFFETRFVGSAVEFLVPYVAIGFGSAVADALYLSYGSQTSIL